MRTFVCTIALGPYRNSVPKGVGTCSAVDWSPGYGAPFLSKKTRFTTFHYENERLEQVA